MMEPNTATETIFEDATAPGRGKAAKRHPLPDDICAAKHGNALASVLAFEKAKLGRQQMYTTLVDLLRQHPMGLTSHEIAEILGLPNRNQFAPRLTELCGMDVCRKTGELRGGCHVVKLLTRYF